ncbi:MAG: prephenate dehydratase domain-containing protein [Collinsella sp.]|nr:prephenate dehydratase domain-containing protein [Collinsella sp.]
MELSQARMRIDDIDARILDLFCERMELASEVAHSKMRTGKAVFDPAREREKLADIAARAPEGLEHSAIALFSLLMSMNKSEQLRIINHSKDESRSQRALAHLLPSTVGFPETGTVCCQGVEGAYSQIAACKLFRLPQITYAPTFEGVFRAIADGTCEFGVLPIENSTAGSVNAVYDLLAKYRFSIVRSLRLKIDHNLLAKPGVRIEDIAEIFSHEQALAQCADFLASLDVSTHVCQNTARAAEQVASSDRRDLAALSSRDCASLYGLETLKADVQDSDNNYTRFVVIARDPAIYPGANRTSIILTLRSEPGALYRVLERIYALDINLVKLESRPIPQRDFEFRFYFDLECSPVSDAFAALLDTLDDVTSSLTYLGSYTEIL